MKKSVISILSVLAGAAAGAGAVGRKEKTKISQIKSLSDKHLALYMLMNDWVRIKQKNKSIADYLAKNGYKEIAIYGMNFVGETLLSELENSDIRVKFAIDKNADTIYSDVNVVLPEDDFEEVDAVIVTPITFFAEIEEILSKKINCPIVSMEDILYELNTLCV